MGQALRTTDHDTIRRWAEERRGRPARLAGPGQDADEPLLKIDFPEDGGDKDEDDDLHEISWDEFFEQFEQKRLAFLYQDRTERGEPSRFNKLVSR